MNIIREHSVLEIDGGRSAGWKAPRDGELLVQEGRVWITRPGDLADYWLGSGERFSVRRGESLWLGTETEPTRALIGFSTPIARG